MKNKVEIEIPSAAEILEHSKFKVRFKKLVNSVVLNAKYIITIAVAIPVFVAVCKYCAIVWGLFF